MTDRDRRSLRIWSLGGLGFVLWGQKVANMTVVWCPVCSVVAAMQVAAASAEQTHA